MAAASTGSAPVASLKQLVPDHAEQPVRRIHGVCPRGLIEACRTRVSGRRGWRASTGSAPVASLKLARIVPGNPTPGRIHGVCPRGLIEARRAAKTEGGSGEHPRGLPPWPH